MKRYLLIPLNKNVILFNSKSITLQITNDEFGKKAEIELEKAVNDGTTIEYRGQDYFVDYELD